MSDVVSNYISSQNWILSTGAEILPGLRLFYFEGASLDARDNKQFSEDFVSYQYKDGCLYFVVCDGIQQSIDASLAARLLGVNLLDVLPAALGNKKIIESFAEELRSSINKKILSVPIDKNDPAYGFHVRARDEIGAQVKFACGVVDFKREKVELYWAGDIRFVIYGKNSEILFSWEGDNNQFWSTKGDYALELSLHSWSIDDVSRLSITSDGVRENFKEILSQKIFLNDTRLVNHRYEIGIDDISGVDIKIVPADSFDRLSNLRGVSLINNKSLAWTHVSRAEKYRIYHSHGDSIQHIAEVDSKQKSYLLPDSLGDGALYVQAISSQAISSELSKPVYYVPVHGQVLEPYLDEPIQSLGSKKSEPKLEPLRPAPDLQPNRLWRRVAVGCGIFGLVLLVAGALSFSFIMNLLMPPTVTLVTESPTYIVFTPIFVKTETPFISSTPSTLHPSFTPPVTSTDSNVAPIETLSFTLTIDSNLDDCQKKTVLDEPGEWITYQIKSGDTFYRLSQVYNITIEELMRVNCYQTSILIAGNYILVPDNK